MPKPNVNDACLSLVTQVRQSFPFDLPVAELCEGICVGCPKKLLEFIEGELTYFEQRINQNDVITLGEIDRLDRQVRKIYRVLKMNELVT